MITVYKNNKEIYHNANAEAIAAGVKSVADLGTQLAKNKNEKDTLPLKILQDKKAQETQLQLSKVDAQKSKVSEQQKTKRTLTITLIALSALAIGVGVFVVIKKRGGKK